MRKIIALLALLIAAGLLSPPSAQSAELEDWEEPTFKNSITDGFSPRFELGTTPFKQPHQALTVLRSNHGKRAKANWVKLRTMSASVWNDEDGDDIKCANGFAANRLRKMKFEAQLFLYDRVSNELNPYAQFKQPDPITIHCDTDNVNMLSKAKLADDHYFMYDYDRSGFPKVRFTWHADVTNGPDEHFHKWQTMSFIDDWDRRAPEDEPTARELEALYQSG